MRKRKKRERKERGGEIDTHSILPVSVGWNGCGSIHLVRKPGMGPMAEVCVAPCWGMGSYNGPVPVGLTLSRGSCGIPLGEELMYEQGPYGTIHGQL